MKTFDSSRFFYKNSDKGIVRTPVELAQEMISNIPEYIFESSTTTFLDPACGRGTFLIQITKKLKSYGHSWENITSRIFGIDIDPFSGIKQAQYILGSKNLIVQDFLEMSFPENWPKEFDVIVSNPPYSSKLDLKFLEKCFDISKESVTFVHPASSFIETKGNNKFYNSINSKIEKNIEKITIFNGNGIFGIFLKVPCSITHISKSKKTKEFMLENLIVGETNLVDSLDKVNVHGSPDIFWSIREKILSKIKDLTSLNDNRKKSIKPDSYMVEFSHIQGHTVVDGESMNQKMYKRNFFVILNDKNISPKMGISPRYKLLFEFSTEIEAKNFISYCKTDFARFCLAISKTSSHLDNGELKTVPWMNFDKKWDDKSLFEFFSLNHNEIEFIKKVIPNFYD